MSMDVGRSVVAQAAVTTLKHRTVLFALSPARDSLPTVAAHHEVRLSMAHASLNRAWHIHRK